MERRRRRRLFGMLKQELNVEVGEVPSFGICIQVLYMSVCPLIQSAAPPENYALRLCIQQRTQNDFAL
jgi:hypothetical protein